MKCRVKVGNLYFSRWLGEDALMIVDDSPGAKYAARLFGNINQALADSFQGFADALRTGGREE